MTTSDFFELMKEQGFNGYTPSPKDIMGDAWARKIGEEFDRLAVDLPRSEFRHRVWLCWQWLYCMIAKMDGRTIAGPQACAIAGMPHTDDIVSKACELLCAAGDIEIPTTTTK